MVRLSLLSKNIKQLWWFSEKVYFLQSRSNSFEILQAPDCCTHMKWGWRRVPRMADDALKWRGRERLISLPVQGTEKHNKRNPRSSRSSIFNHNSLELQSVLFNHAELNQSLCMLSSWGNNSDRSMVISYINFEGLYEGFKLITMGQIISNQCYQFIYIYIYRVFQGA